MADGNLGSGACTAECIGSACGKSSELPLLPQSKNHPWQPVLMATAPGMIEFKNKFHIIPDNLGYKRL